MRETLPNSATAVDIEAMCRKLDRIVSQAGRALTFMEVCGTHTVAIFRSGLRSILPENLRLLSGPGCPVCVTDQREIDIAISLAAGERIVLTYGDMMRVPGSGVSGSSNSLAKMRSSGARIEVVTSAIQSIKIAKDNPNSEVVFLGVGFETTAPGTAATLKQAAAHGLRNFSVLCLHKTVPPVMRTLCANPELKIDGFILPGNVTVITGLQDYAFLASEYNKAAVAAGFEPEEILGALVELSRQVIDRRFSLGAYRLNNVPKAGNPAALKILSEVFEPCDAVWRGLGQIQGSGLHIAKAYSRFDAAERFALAPSPAAINSEKNSCRCGEILTGLMTPPECGLYGTACTPENPFGPCMVSSEGTCGAWYRFNR